ncbi:hypothetical protein D917_00471, partial [Trichinella nativa]
LKLHLFVTVKAIFLIAAVRAHHITAEDYRAACFLYNSVVIRFRIFHGFQTTRDFKCFKMADELENFFKSKKKLAAKKRNVQNPDMLCRRLEQAVQVQEMYEYADGEEWPVHSYEQPEPQEKPKEETTIVTCLFAWKLNFHFAALLRFVMLYHGDSEWLEVDDSQNFAPTVEDLKMNDDIDEDEEETEQPPPKQRTWNVNPEINGAAEVEKPVESNLENKTNENVYVPPCMRNRLNAPAKRDANFRTEEFPTLADAEVILKSDAELNKQKQVDPPNPWMKSKPPKQEEQEPLYVPVFARRGNNIGRGGNNIGHDNGIGPGSSNASGISNGPGTNNGPGNSSGSGKEQKKDKDSSETESDVYVPPYLRNRNGTFTSTIHVLHSKQQYI